MKRKKILALLLSAVMVVSMTGCGGANKDSGNDTASVTEDASGIKSPILDKYPGIIDNEGDPIENGVLKVGLVSDSPFKGIFNPFLYSDGIDNSIMQYTMSGAMVIDEDFRIRQDSDEAPVNFHIDPEKKTATFKLNPKFRWNNGDPVSAQDIVKTYEIFANQEYIEAAKSPRFGTQNYIIEGIKDYNEGKADKISGLEIVDDSTLVIHLTDINPGVYYGGPFAGEFVNAKQFDGIPMKKIQESDALRKNPLSYGPYYITNIVPGEKVDFAANPYYYKGEPKVKKLSLEIVPASQQVAAVKAGTYDILLSPGGDPFPDFQQLNNIKLASRVQLSMDYLGFKLGKWDPKKNEVVVDPDAKMADPALRKALAHAIDNNSIGQKFYHGLRFLAPSVIGPVFTDLRDPNLEPFNYDTELSKKLLDDAGYKDVDGDGFRETPDGKPLVVNLAMMAGGEVSEPLSQYYIQQWKDIGVNAQLVDGRLLDFQYFYQQVQDDDPKIDAYVAAWGLASDPNPTGLYGKNEYFNFTRYTSPALEEALDKINSNESIDRDKMIEYFHNFDKVFHEEAPLIPQMNRIEYIVINNRVKHYEFNWKDGDFDWSKIELVADSPVVAS